MKKQFHLHLLSFYFLFFLPGINLQAQETPLYGKHAFSFNITRAAINEIGLSYEYWLSIRKSIEFNGGIIYVNNFLEDQAKHWNNADIFNEHGYVGRLHFKQFKRTEENSKWHNYISYGGFYKHLYFNDRPIESVIKRDSSKYNIHDPSTKDSIFKYSIQALEKRNRNIFGVEFLWGSVYELNRTFALEFYYGASLSATMVTRTEHERYVNYVDEKKQSQNFYYPDLKFDSFYFRPGVRLGIKLRVRF